MKYLISIKLLFLAALMVVNTIVHAQDNELEPVDDTASALGAILGGKGKGVSKVKLISDTEQSLSVEAEVKGFDDSYKIKGVILNKMKKPVAEVVSEGKTMPKGDGTVELKFQFKQGGANYKTSFIESHFLSLTVAKADNVLSNLDIGGETLFGDTYVYKLNKKWRLNGSESMVIEVKLTPFKSAASVKP